MSKKAKKKAIAPKPAGPRLRSTNPDAFIIFYRYAQPVTTIGSAFSVAANSATHWEVRQDILNLTTNKPKGGHGTWSATLAPRLDYLTWLQPGTWCMIHMLDQNLEEHGSATNGSNTEAGLKMLGIVRSVRCVEATDPGSGIRQARYIVSGDDFHSVFDSQIYINPNLKPQGSNAVSPVINALLLFKDNFSKPQSPDQIVRSLVKVLLGQQGSLSDLLTTNAVQAGGVYGIPTEVARRLTGAAATDSKFVNVLNLLFYDSLMGTLYIQPDLGDQFTLWSMISSYSHSVLNEVFTDLFPINGGKNAGVRYLPSLVMRPIPFSQNPPGGPTLRIRDTQPYEGNGAASGYGFYTSKEIAESDIVSLNYGKSDAERFNFFFLSSNMLNQYGLSGNSLYPLLASEDDSTVAGIASITDPNSIFRHGLRPFITQSMYINRQKGDIKTANILIRDMWQNSPLFDNGQVTIMGSHSHIPVGTNIHFPERGWYAHVEGVSHSFFINPNGNKTFRTTISFVRLQRKDGTPIDLNSGATADGQQAMPKGEYDQGVSVTRLTTYPSAAKPQKDGA
jgi:hypothetical protein